MNDSPFHRLLVAVVTLPLTLLAGSTTLDAATSMAYRIPAVSDPGDAIVVYVDLTSNRDNIASIGARLTYDQTMVSLSSVEPGGAVPGSWSVVYLDSSTPGEIDISMTDQTSAAATIAGPVASIEVVKLTFSRIAVDCNPSTYGYNAAAPVTPAQIAAFPQNQYIIYVTTSILLEAATTTDGSGPVTGDHAFIRGNVNARAAHGLDIGDVVDLVANLFSGFNPGYDCEGAFDVNNDSLRNITDIVALVQGVFGTAGYVIPAPNSANPGPGVPGLTVPDGGSIPSALGCQDGEACL